MTALLIALACLAGLALELAFGVFVGRWLKWAGDHQ